MLGSPVMTPPTKPARRYQIKSRSIRDSKRANVQRLGTLRHSQDWDAVLMALMDDALRTLEIWKAERDVVVETLMAPGSKARNQRGALSVSKFRQIGVCVWPEPN